jgi:hypothetical protein
MPAAEEQCASTLLLIRPAAFAANPETAASNSFQSTATPAARHLVSRAALEEFANCARQLDAAGIDTIIVGDTPVPAKPDAIFPNNWLSTHADGTIVLYPMMAPSRRFERRPEIIEAAARERGLAVKRIIDLSFFEAQNRFLEGTGSLVLDRINRIAYACLSPRTDREALSEFGARLGYEAIAFRAFDNKGLAIYHTNVMLSIGTEFAVVCSECIEESSRARVLASLRATRSSIIEASRSQMDRFACNILEVKSRGDGRVVLMSETAARALHVDESSPPGVERIVAIDIPTIERFGGGSLRCMLAEIFLPPADQVA